MGKLGIWGMDHWRLDSSGMNTAGWSAETTDKHPWMKIDLRQGTNIAGIVTQKRGDPPLGSQYVTKLKVEVSLDGEHWEFMRNEDCRFAAAGCQEGEEEELIFEANRKNVHFNTKAYIYFDEAVKARWVRIWPTEWTKPNPFGSNHVSMRAGVLRVISACPMFITL